MFHHAMVMLTGQAMRPTIELAADEEDLAAGRLHHGGRGGTLPRLVTLLLLLDGLAC